MGKRSGKLKPKTINNIRLEVGENILGNIISTEVLFYVLTDTLGMSNSDARFWTLQLNKKDGFGGGEIFTGDTVSNIICERWTAYELNPKQASRFVNRYMKSTRIIQIDKQPYKWKYNGFGIDQSPYIAGFERGVPQ